MTHRELLCAVAGATGEDVREIRRRGFNLADPFDVQFDPEPCDLPPQVIDWDQVQAARRVPVVPQRCRRQSIAV